MPASILFVEIVERFAFRDERFLVEMLINSEGRILSLFATILHPGKDGSDTTVI